MNSDRAGEAIFFQVWAKKSLSTLNLNIKCLISITCQPFVSSFLESCSPVTNPRVQHFTFVSPVLVTEYHDKQELCGFVLHYNQQFSGMKSILVSNLSGKLLVEDVEVCSHVLLLVRNYIL